MNKIFPANHGSHNYLHTLFLLAGMLSLLSLIGWLFAGTTGIGWFILIGFFILISAPRIPPRLLLRLYHARALQTEEAPLLFETINRLCAQADMKYTPELFYIPDGQMNAFSTGLNEKNAVIAISDGMLRALDPRELNGVLAHEISHIRSNDLLVMQIADIMSRLTGILAFAGYLLIWIYFPLYLLTDAKIPWMLLLVLMLAPTLSSLMQLALSRTREYNADETAARLTGDPLGLASALEKIEHYQGNWLEKLFIPGRRIPEPSLLRTHPLMSDRIRRLMNMADAIQSVQRPGDLYEKHD